MRTGVVVLALLLAAPALAHRLAPASLALRELGSGGVEATFRTARLATRGSAPVPLWPAHCRPLGDPESSHDAVAATLRLRLACGDPGLVGAEVGVAGLVAGGGGALVRVTLADGREIRAALSAARPSLVIPARRPTRGVALEYLRLGAGHLAAGADHVLLVLGLLVLLPGLRAAALAVSAFTLGHALTLGLAVGAGVTLPAGPVELAIAATLVALGCEALREPHAPGRLARFPALVALGFGLVHGLGFAGVLGAIGLPGEARALALASFNLGIELAQLALVALAWPLLVALRASARPRLAVELPATAIGSAGVWLALERGLSWLAGA